MALYETNLISGRIGETHAVENVVTVSSKILQNGSLFGDDFVVKIVVVTLLPNGHGRNERIGDFAIIELRTPRLAHDA